MKDGFARIPLNVAKELIEHSNISVTAKIYTHMVDEVFEQNRKQLAEYASQKRTKNILANINVLHIIHIDNYLWK